eukprot:GHVU01038027.1.p1 GENE.GHVU01038027.1~~GHVU01038027.1.p1  ORF type:complete len:172 (-),score=11.61 GHVU01038027.1:729-1244(-)
MNLTSIYIHLNTLLRSVDADFIKRKTSADLDYVHQGGNISKTVDFIQDNAASLHSEPIIIHTGTNDVVHESQITTERRFRRLEVNLLYHKYSKVAISSIIYRDAPLRVRASIKKLNVMLCMMCTRNKWIFIDNDALNDSSLGHDGLHLNGYGYEQFRSTLSKGISELLVTH